MSFYLFQWQYKDPAIKAMVDLPQDRPQELRKAVEVENRQTRVISS